MKVYIVEGFAGVNNEEYQILSVHSTLQKAMDYYPDEQWEEEEPGMWTNGKDASAEEVLAGAPAEFKYIVEMEVDPDAP